MQQGTCKPFSLRGIQLTVYTSNKQFTGSKSLPEVNKNK